MPEAPAVSGSPFTGVVSTGVVSTGAVVFVELCTLFKTCASRSRISLVFSLVFVTLLVVTIWIGDVVVASFHLAIPCLNCQYDILWVHLGRLAFCLCCSNFITSFVSGN